MQTKTGIIFLQRDKFQLYSPYLPTILEFRFVQELIQDFDLVNRDLLEDLIKVFIANNKISASNLVIVLADNASFMKDFVLSTAPAPIANPQQIVTPLPTLADLQEQANLYLEHVPFESIASRTFPLANGVRAFATNQEIYEALRTILEKQGFIIGSVLPGFVFDQGISSKPSLDAAGITFILQKLPTLQAYNLLKESSSLPMSSVTEEVEEKEKDNTSDNLPQDEEKNKKMLLAVGISAIVLICAITGGILYWQFTTPPYKPPVQAPTLQAVPTQAPTTQPIPSIVTAPELTVQITHASSSATQVKTLETTLSQYAFKTITKQIQNNLGTAQTLLIFSPRVDAETKAAVTEAVKEIFSGVLIQEKPDTSFDISIIIGR